VISVFIQLWGPQQYFFYDERSEILEQVAKRSFGCPIIGSVQSQIGRGFEQPGLGVPACGKGVGLDDL